MIKPLIGILVTLAISCGITLAGSQGSIEENGLPLFLICASVGFILHWIVFVPSFILQTEHYFDLTGSISYVSTITAAYLFHPDMECARPSCLRSHCYLGDTPGQFSIPAG